MPDLEISNLPELTGAGLTGDDPVAIADLSASETKKITAKNLVQSGIALVDDASIPGAKLAANSVGAGQLAADSVGSSELADGAVDTAAIQASAVTDAKVASGISGSKLTDATVSAAKLGTVTDRGLDQVGGSIGHTNSLTAGSAAGISFDAQGHITATTSIPAADLPLATTTTVGGVSVPTDGGLEVSVTGELRHENDVTAAIVANISYDEHGHILSATNILASHLPIALTDTVGAVRVPSAQGLNIDALGSIGLSDSGVIAGTYTKVTVDDYGRTTTGASLAAADIPSVDASKISTGQFATARIADDAITGAKLANSSTTKFGEIQPTADYTGQFFFNPLTRDLVLWDGNVFQPVGISAGEIVLAGTYDASTNLLDSVTAEGSAAGFTSGQALPAADTGNNRYYVVVSQTGTGTAPAPTVTLEPPDILLSNGSSYVLIETSETITAQVASNVGFTPYGNIASTNVQGAIAELDDEKVAKAGDTMTGDLNLGAAVNLVFEGATDNDFETTVTVTDPTADRTITLPDLTGTVALTSQLDDGTY
jgi:hypothetical protein